MEATSNTIKAACLAEVIGHEAIKLQTLRTSLVHLCHLVYPNNKGYALEYFKSLILNQVLPKEVYDFLMSDDLIEKDLKDE